MDIVADILGRMQSRLGAASCGQIRDLETEIRRDWGGDVTYIRQADASESLQRRNAAMLADRRHGLSVRDIAAKYRISKSLVQKMISEHGGNCV